MIRRLLDLRRDERGVLMPIVALSMVALIGATSLTIDVGRLANRQRDLQAIADVVALDAAGALVGADLPTLVAGDFGDVLVDAAERNGVRVDGSPTLGYVAGDPATFVPSTDPALADVNAWQLDGEGDAVLVAVAGALDGTGAFVPAAVPPSPDAVSAVSVWMRDRVEYVFGVGQALTDRTGIAEAAATTGIGMWASLASVSTNDEALGGLLGALLDVDATVISPAGIAGSSIALGDLAAELDFGSVSELLAATVTLEDLVGAQADVLRADGATVAADALDAIEAELGGGSSLSLAEIVSVGTGGSVAAANATLDVLSLLTATAMVVGGDPTHAIALEASVLGVPASLTVIEAPVYAFGAEGVTVDTAQISLSLDPDPFAIDTGWLTGNQCGLGISGLLGCILGPVLGNVVKISGPVDAPVTVDVAGGQAVLDQLACSPAGHTATLDVSSSGVTVTAPIDATLTAEVLGSLGTSTVGVSLDGTVESLASALDEVAFGGTDNAFDEPVHTPGDTSLATIDVSNAEIDFTVAAVEALSLSSGTTTNLLSSAITSQLLTPIDQLVEQVLAQIDVLGLGLAGADVIAFSPTCDIARLAG